MDNSLDFYDYDEDTWDERPEHDAVEGGNEYDALNDETFGSAADDGDWEQNHEQLSNITEAEKHHNNFSDSLGLRLKAKSDSALKCAPFGGFENTLESLHLNERPRPVEGYSHPPVSIPSSLGNEYSSGSPVESIWSALFKKELPTSLTTKPIKSQADHHTLDRNLASIVPPRTIPSFKTVSELEQEMKWQHGAQQIHAVMKLEEIEQELTHRRGGHQSPLLNSNVERHGMLPHYQHQQPLKLHSMSSPALPFNNMQNQHQHMYLKEKNTGFQHSNNFHPHLINEGKNSGYPVKRNYFVQGFPNKTMPPNVMNHKKFPHNRSDPMRMRHNNYDMLNRTCRTSFEHLKGNSEGMNGFVKEYSNNSGHRMRRDSDSEWEEWLLLREKDEYAGLMTPREKNWLKNIQSMQLQSENPYQDDYYYVMHKAHEQRKRGQDIIEINGLQLLADKAKDGKEYEPPHLENSLGKLQVVSVNAPRKIIDFDSSQSGVGGTTSPTSRCLQSDMRKRRHLLLHIEKLWDVHIELADLERKIRALPDCPTRDLYKVKCRQLVGKLWTGLTSSQEPFIQVLCIRKGKTLCSHLLRWLGENEVEHVVATLVQNVSLIYKRDSQDGQLDQLWPCIDRLFASASSTRLTTFAIMFSSQLKQTYKNDSIPVLDCKLIFSILLAMLVRGEQLWHELEKECIWQDFLSSIVSALLQSSRRVESRPDTSSPASNAPPFCPAPLPSVSLVASPRNITSQILRCTAADSNDVLSAADVLKSTESLLKNVPL